MATKGFYLTHVHTTYLDVEDSSVRSAADRYTTKTSDERGRGWVFRDDMPLKLKDIRPLL